MLVAPVAEELPDELEATVQGLMARGLDVHLVLEAEERASSRRDKKPTASLTGRIHRTADEPPGGWRSRRVRRTAAVLRELEAEIVHFTSAERARCCIRRAGVPGGARVITRFSALEAGVSGLEQPGYFDSVWERSAAIEAPDEAVLARLRRRGCGPELLAAVVPHFIHPGFATPPPHSPRRIARDFHSASAQLRVISMGPIEWPAGSEYAAQAIAEIATRVGDVRWRVVGDGAALPALVYACDQLGIGERLQVLDPRKLGAQRPVLLWADVFVASGLIDGLPPAAAEALVAGLPVIASDPGPLGAQDLERDAVITVPRRDPQAMADALAMLAGDDALRTKIAARGRRWAMEWFRSDLRLRRLDELYRRVAGLGSQAAPPARRLRPDRVSVT